MNVAEQIARVRVEGEALARAAEAGPLDLRVPGCPDWDVEALLRHMGDVHRWAGTIVRNRLQERLRRDSEAPPGRDALLDWYRDGHAALVEALEGASPDDTFWYWGPAPNALAFWARRQANETAIHRCDAESAHGPITPLSAPDALDALDEWLGLAPLRGKASDGGGRTLHLHATDGEGEWLVTLDERIEVTSGHAKADCALQGTAFDLYLWAMNRAGAEALRVFGDTSLLRVWADNVRF